MRKSLTIRKRFVALPTGLLLLIGVALGSLLLLPAPRASMSPPSPVPTPSPTVRCWGDRDCSDGLFCNGPERCRPTSELADARGCVPAIPPRECRPPLVCDEDIDECVRSCTTDADHDLHIAWNCGGDDCDDHDVHRHPGAVEFCDRANPGHDEDCNPLTYGHRDVDRDGEDDFRCFNRERNGVIHRGADYDDNSPAIRMGSMICDGADAVVVSGSFLPSVPCPTGTKCVVQPNRTGICIGQPANYQPPPRFEWPLLPDNSVTVSPLAVTAVIDSVRGDAAEVAECRSTLQSGKVSWGGGTNWAPKNIDMLCNGTRNARTTIACFQSNVKAGWAAAIDKCK